MNVMACKCVDFTMKPVESMPWFQPFGKLSFDLLEFFETMAVSVVNDAASLENKENTQSVSFLVLCDGLY